MQPFLLSLCAMRYFGNIFICSYRVYKKLEKQRDPRFTSSILISMCFTAILFMVCVIMQKKYNIYNNPLYILSNYPFILVGFGIAEMFLVYQYYSEERITFLNTQFENKIMIEKYFWGLMSILTLVVPFVIGAIVLNN